MDSTFAHNLAKALSEASEASKTSSRIEQQLGAVVKSTDIRELMFALMELNTALGKISSPLSAEEKAVQHTLVVLHLHIKTLMNLDVSDDRFAAAWTPVSKAVLAKALPMEVHGEIMLLYMRVCAVRKGQTHYKNHIDAAQTAVELFCQHMGTTSPTLPGGD